MTILDQTIDKGQTRGGMPRRDFLRTALGAASLAVVARPASAGATPGGRSATSAAPGVQQVCDYLERLRRPDGGYAWADQAQFTV